MSADDLRERTVICSESIEAFKVISPDLLRDLSKAPKPQIQAFFKVLVKLIMSPEESPGKKFYSLYLLLKASETNPNQDFLSELAAKEDLQSFIFWIALREDKDLELSQRGRTYFLKNPTQNEANMGINFVRLCIELVIYWGKYFGKKDPADPKHVFWKRFDKLAKATAELPKSFIFIGKDYSGRTEIASWNFEKSDLPSSPYKPTDSNAARNEKSASISEVQEDRGLINIKRVTYDDTVSKEKADSRANLDRILKSDSYDLSPQTDKVSPMKSAQLSDSLTETKYSRKEELMKKALGEPGSKNNIEAQRSKPSSKIFEDNSRSKSANLLEQQADLMKKVNNNELDTSLNNSYSSRGGFESRGPSKKLTFGVKMTEAGVFEERSPASASERRKSPLGTQIQSNPIEGRRTTMDRTSPARRDGSPIDLKASTDNIRNFFNEKDKPQNQPNRVAAKVWETNQSSPSKMFSADSTPQFTKSQAGRFSKSPTLEQKTFEPSEAESAGLARKGPVARSGNPVVTNEPGRKTPSKQDVGEESPTEVKILTKQIESFRNENAFLMNEIQRYQEEFKRRMELEKLLLKENNNLKATIAKTNQQLQEVNATMTDLYDKNQRLAQELQETKNQLE